ncbi:MAG: uracil-DNA glycosylase [Cytophagia bacterium]|nr:uracil-DNA glycosylase [Cytophagia bacterium]
MKVKIENSWKHELKKIFDSRFFYTITKAIKKEYKSNEVYPKGSDIFNAFNLCPFDKLKVVIIGQDPYHGYGQANGLCFSVNSNIKIPPSLKNIYKELKYNYSDFTFKDGDLSNWANQGVLLLNSILTVRKGQPGSHKQIGWEIFTDSVIKTISKRKKKIVFILWGAFAKSKSKLIDKNKHLILESSHPSPFSAYSGFFHQNHFIKTNNYLSKNGYKKIDW